MCAFANHFLIISVAICRASAEFATCDGSRACSSQDSAESYLAKNSNVVSKEHKLVEDISSLKDMINQPVTGRKLLEMEASVERMAVSNYKPTEAELGAWEILETYLESIKNASFFGHKEDQGEINDAYERLVACVAKVQEKIEPVNALKIEVAASNANNTECVSDKARMLNKQTTSCLEYERVRNQPVSDSLKIVIDMWPQTNAEDEHAEDGLLDKDIKRAYDWYTVVFNAMKACKTDGNDYKAKVVACDHIQIEYEKIACEFTTSNTNVCDEYESCYEDALVAYEKREQEVRTEESRRKSEFVSCVKIKCLLDVLFDSDSEDTTKTQAVNECHNSIVVTDHLNIKYPKTPDHYHCEESPSLDFSCH